MTVGEAAVQKRFQRREPYDPSWNWPEPDMAVLRLQRREAPKLPIEIFGKWEQWIKDSAEAAACPVDYVVAPLLTSASALIGHARWARANTWAEPPHLWTASVGDSGDGKSPGADGFYRDILPEIERKMMGNFPDRLQEAQTEIEIAAAQHDIWKTQMKDAIKNNTSLLASPPPIPEPPVSPRLVMGDITIEKVAVQLAHGSPKGVLMNRDELVGWL